MLALLYIQIILCNVYRELERIQERSLPTAFEVGGQRRGEVYIGTHPLQGISGGEKKRLAVASEVSTLNTLLKS